MIIGLIAIGIVVIMIVSLEIKDRRECNERNIERWVRENIYTILEVTFLESHPKKYNETFRRDIDYRIFVAAQKIMNLLLKE